MTVAIGGGSGFIGSVLSERLISLGHKVVIIDIFPPRFTHENLFYINCDLSKTTVPYNALESVDVVINLAGKNIFGKWTESYKQEIRTSRVNSTQNLIESISQTKNKPGCLICASAIGFYGDTGEEEVFEQSPKGESFLADIVFDWEQEAKKAQEFGVRVVCLRTAPVLGNGGFLAVLKKVSKFGFLMKLSKKDFWMSWVHQEDLIASYLFAIETTTLQGVVNVSAPESIRHSHFMKIFGRVFHRPVFGHVPSFFMKLFFGDFFDEITKSQRVLPKRLLDKGFIFTYTDIEGALIDIKKHAKN